MDAGRKTALRNELTRYASRYWAGEAEVARTFFAGARTGEDTFHGVISSVTRVLEDRDTINDPCHRPQHGL